MLFIMPTPESNDFIFSVPLFQVVAVILPQSELCRQIIKNNCLQISGKNFTLCFNFFCDPWLYGRENGEKMVDTVQYLTISPHGDAAT